jgi:hypothetical protein
VESLETRCLLHGFDSATVVLNAGVLEITGDKHGNVIDVSEGASNRIFVQIDGEADPSNPNGYDPAQVQSLHIRGMGGHDQININSNLSLPSNVTGDKGNDTITGGSGPDKIDGGAGRDSITGGDGDDSLLGAASNDILLGDNGLDILNGGKGNDSLDGGGDDDVLQTGSGRDTVKGGSGDDLFGAANRGSQRVDFTVGEDVDAGSPVTVGSFTDLILGTRTDQLPGAPDVTDSHHDNSLTDSFYPLNGYTNPPTYGPHRFSIPSAGHSKGAPVQPTGTHDDELPDVDVVHNLEHGHVWIAYDPAQVSAADVDKLRAIVETFGGRGQGIVLAPRTANDDPIALVSWAHHQTLTSFDLVAISNFIITNRGHAPEGFITP